jgi:hypothetical protein
MAWAYRASSYANDSGGWTALSTGGTKAVTLGAAVSSGDLLVFAVGAASTSGAAPTYSVSDSVNGSWSATADASVTWADASNTARLSVYSFPNSAAGTPVITVTVTTSVSTFGGLQCAAYSGIATSSQKDTSGAGSGTGATASSGATGSESASSELVVGAYHDLGYGTTLTKDAAYTQRGKHDADGNFWQGLFEDKSSSGSTDTATTSTGSTTWGQVAVVYKLSGGAAAGPIARFIEPLQNTQGLVSMQAVARAANW